MVLNWDKIFLSNATVLSWEPGHVVSCRTRHVLPWRANLVCFLGSLDMFCRGNPDNVMPWKTRELLSWRARQCVVLDGR